MTNVSQSESNRVKKENLERANQQASQADIEQKAKEALRVQSPLSGILKMLEEVNIDTPEHKRSVQELSKSYERSELAHLFTTMWMFLKKNVLSEQSFKWLKSAMNFIDAIANITLALFNKGFLNALNLDKLMNIPLLKSLKNLFGLIDAQDNNFSQNSFDEAVKNVGGEVANGIGKDNKSSSAFESVARTATSAFKSDEIISAVANSKLAKEGIARLEQFRDDGIEIAADVAKRVIKEEVTSEDVRNFMREHVGDLITPEVKQAATEIVSDAAKQTLNAGYESAIGFATSCANKLGSSFSSLLNTGFGFFKPADDITSVKPDADVQDQAKPKDAAQAVLQR